MQFTTVTVFLVFFLVLLGLVIDNKVDAVPLARRVHPNTNLHVKKQHVANRKKRDLDEDEQVEEEERFLNNDDDNVDQDFQIRSVDESDDVEDQEVRVDDNNDESNSDEIEKRAIDLSEEESNSDEKRK